MGIVYIVLRAFQLIFAVIVMGTDGHAVYLFHGYTSEEHTWFGDLELYTGVPNAWSFLLFCAAWTFLGVLFIVLTEFFFVGRALVDYARAAVEFVALLSWLAGFIAVAVNIGTNACSVGESSCALLEAATVFGAVEWLLFVVTTIMTAKLVFNNYRQKKSSQGSTPETHQISPAMPA